MNRLILSLLLVLGLNGFASADNHGAATPPAMDEAMMRQMIDGSIQRFPLAEDVSVDDAIDSMSLRANMLNFKLVADLPLSEQVEAMGEPCADREEDGGIQHHLRRLPAVPDRGR